jgi:hypothetical protein
VGGKKFLKRKEPFVVQQQTQQGHFLTHWFKSLLAFQTHNISECLEELNKAAGTR